MQELMAKKEALEKKIIELDKRVADLNEVNQF